MNIAPDIYGILPEIALAVFGIIVLGVDLLLKGKDKTPVAVISLIGYVAAFMLLLLRWDHTGLYMHDLVAVKPYISLFQMIFLVAAFVTVLLSISYLKREGFQYGEYYGLLLFVVLGMFIMASAADLLVFFLGLELMSIALYITVGLFRTRRESNEAAIKYLIMGAFASAFLLYGIALIYGATGTTKIGFLISSMTSTPYLCGSVMMILGMIFIVVGFSFKLAFVPFHMWTPDVYQGAPTPLTGFMSVAVKGAAYAALITVLITLFPMRNEWVILLEVLAVITMTAGNVAALRQNNIKRMLAYSSIAHAGYILVGVVALSIKATRDIVLSSVLFYIAGYLLMNIGAFAVSFIVAGKDDEKYDISSYTGLSYRRPTLSALMSIFMFSLIGIPPLVGFMAKFQIFYSAIKADFVVLAIIGVLNSVLAVYYYLRVVVTMYMQKPDMKTKDWIETSGLVYLVIILLAAGVIIIGLFPSIVMDVITTSL
jgi:NADH-quinone oxidoreductase subunit N